MRGSTHTQPPLQRDSGSRAQAGVSGVHRGSQGGRRTGKRAVVPVRGHCVPSMACLLGSEGPTRRRNLKPTCARVLVTESAGEMSVSGLKSDSRALSPCAAGGWRRAPG